MKAEAKEAYFLISILVFVRRTRQQDGQRFLFFEKCPPRYCPIDCTKLTAPDNCPSCHCPEGYRCPTVLCPAGIQAPECGLIQKMDGCQSCACQKPAFSIYTARSHTVRYYIGNPPAFTRYEAGCRISDIKKVEGCMETLKSYHKFHWIRNPDIAISTVPWTKFRKDFFEEFCELLDQVPRCAGGSVMGRCRKQETFLSEMMAIYEFPCISHRQQFFEEYDCIFNVMAAHRHMRSCERKLDQKMHKTRKGDYRLKQKIAEKCDTFNEFLDCARPTMLIFCGGHAWNMFSGAFMSSSPMTAPECNVGRQRFSPKVIRDTFTRLDKPSNTSSSVERTENTRSAVDRRPVIINAGGGSIVIHPPSPRRARKSAPVSQEPRLNSIHTDKRPRTDKLRGGAERTHSSGGEPFKNAQGISARRISTQDSVSPRINIAETVLKVRSSSGRTRDSRVVLNVTLEPKSHKIYPGSSDNRLDLRGRVQKFPNFKPTPTKSLASRRINRKRSPTTGRLRLPVSIQRPRSLRQNDSVAPRNSAPVRQPSRLGQFVRFHGRKRRRRRPSKYRKYRSNGSSRCDRVPPRAECPGGRRPQAVMRWYRPKNNATDCHSYQYNYCGRDVELLDNPLRYEETCYRICFDEKEKEKMQTFKDIRFSNGFRIDDDLRRR